MRVAASVPPFLIRKVTHPDSGRAIAAAALSAEIMAERFVVFPLLCDLMHYNVPRCRQRAVLAVIRRDIPKLKPLLS